MVRDLQEKERRLSEEAMQARKQITAALKEIKRLERSTPPPPSPSASVPQRPSNGKTEEASQPVRNNIDKGYASHTGEKRTNATAPRNQDVSTKGNATPTMEEAMREFQAQMLQAMAQHAQRFQVIESLLAKHGLICE